MEAFLKKEIKTNKFELEIDTNIFKKDIVLKASFLYLDKGYFFFKTGSMHSIILQFTAKEGFTQSAEKIICDFTDTLLETSLRDKLEKDNRVIREAIVTKALYGPMDTANYVPEQINSIELGDPNAQASQLDFDKDIEDIIKEIENDPDLQIDEDEIQQMLDEIEKESNSIPKKKPSIRVDTDSVKDAKKKFKKKK